MVEKIDRILKTDDNLFVGYTAPHVVGPYGVVEKLKEKGWILVQEL